MTLALPKIKVHGEKAKTSVYRRCSEKSDALLNVILKAGSAISFFYIKASG
jgi:hypothetical protein